MNHTFIRPNLAAGEDYRNTGRGGGAGTKNVTVMKFRFMFSTLYNWPDIFAPLVDISFEIHVFQKLNSAVLLLSLQII